MNKFRLYACLLLLALVATCYGDSHTIDKWLLPENHLIALQLEKLFVDRAIFRNSEAAERRGFTFCVQPETILPNSILVLSHPKIPGYLIKKYPNRLSRSKQLANYLARLRGAQQISDYVAEMNFTKIVVPKKWLYELPTTFDSATSAKKDYLLIVEKLDICPGGWWGGPNYEKYMNMTATHMRELCQVLHAIGGCDAWPRNQPFTHDGKIAFIDTEHVGTSPGDFMRTTLQFINPELQAEAEAFWDELEREAMVRQFGAIE